MAAGYRLAFGRGDLDLGELAGLFTTLDQLYLAAVTSVTYVDYDPHGPLDLPLFPRPPIARVSKTSPLQIDLGPIVEHFGPYGLALSFFIGVLRNAEEIGRLPFHLSEG